jgi:aspartate aminotransferase
MTGWRIGYAAGPREIIEAAANLQSHSTSNPATMCQDAALAALTGDQACVEQMRREFEKRRDLIVTRLNAIPGVTCAKPQGAFYVFPRLAGLYGRKLGGVLVQGSLDFGRVALEQGRVATVPGIEFGADEYVRLSYACSTERIIEGMNRLERLCAAR